MPRGLERRYEQQNFWYDGLNRLTSAYSAHRTPDASYNFTYNYDSFGNMLPVDTNSGFRPYSIDPSTNRLLNGADLTYYPNGNLATANSHAFSYTAEGYLRSIDAYQLGSYLYNAQGQRTLSARNDQGDHSRYSVSENVYLGGQPVAEVHEDGYGVSWVWTNYVYANGQKIARLVGMVHAFGQEITGSRTTTSTTSPPTAQPWTTSLPLLYRGTGP